MPPETVTTQRDWQPPPPKYTILGCPVCHRTIAVLEGCDAWCPHNGQLVPMTREAT